MWYTLKLISRFTTSTVIGKNAFTLTRDKYKTGLQKKIIHIISDCPIFFVQSLWISNFIYIYFSTSQTFL